MFKWIFNKKYKNTTFVFWAETGNQVFNKKLRFVIRDIKPFRNRLFGIKNRPASFGFVTDAMEVTGEALENIGKNEIFFLVPEYEIQPFQPQDKVELWISDKGYCFKIQKIPI